MRTISVAERRVRLARRHHLARPTESVEQVAADLVGIHSSDPATVYLTARARIADFDVADLEGALYDRRSLLRMLGMRRTMFVVPIDLAGTMNVACTRAFVAAERGRLIGFLEEQGVVAAGEEWLGRVEAAVLASLAARGEATAAELKEDVPELEARLSFGEGKTWAGTVGVSTRVLFLLATAGHIVRARPKGSWVSSQYRWTATADWVPGGLPEPALDVAQQDLVRRWLRGYGPGTERDLAWWTGWGIRRTRAALEAVDAVEVDLEHGAGYVLPEDLDAPEPVEPWVALLPSLDSTVMGWKERDWYVGDLTSHLYDRNGNAGPTVWANGRIVGGWGQRPDGEVVFRLLRDVGRSARADIEFAASRLGDWLGDTRIRARFPTPLEKELMA